MPAVDLPSVGPLELATLKAVAALGAGEAYGQSVKDEVSRKLKYCYGHGTIYSAIERLVGKGLVEYAMSKPRPIPGGRKRKMCRLTGLGKKKLADGG